MRENKRKVAEVLLELRAPVGINTKQLTRSQITGENFSRDSNTGAITQTVTVDDNSTTTITTLVSPQGTNKSSQKILIIQVPKV